MTEQKQALNLQEIKLLEDKGLKKLSSLTKIPLEQLSQKERLKATRVRETMKETKEASEPQTDTLQLQLIVAFSPILKSALQKISYCLIDRPKIPYGLNREEVKHLLTELIDKLRAKMALPFSFRNLFTKDGSRVTSICDVIEGDYTFFFSPLPNMDLLCSGSVSKATDALWRIRFLSEVVTNYRGSQAGAVSDRDKSEQKAREVRHARRGDQREVRQGQGRHHKLRLPQQLGSGQRPAAGGLQETEER